MLAWHTQHPVITEQVDGVEDADLRQAGEAVGSQMVSLGDGVQSSRRDLRVRWKIHVTGSLQSGRADIRYVRR
jgi:hypothetical protein